MHKDHPGFDWIVWEVSSRPELLVDEQNINELSNIVLINGPLFDKINKARRGILDNNEELLRQAVVEAAALLQIIYERISN